MVFVVFMLIHRQVAHDAALEFKCNQNAPLTAQTNNGARRQRDAGRVEAAPAGMPRSEEEREGVTPPRRQPPGTVPVACHGHTFSPRFTTRRGGDANSPPSSAGPPRPAKSGKAKRKESGSSLVTALDRTHSEAGNQIIKRGARKNPEKLRRLSVA